MECEIAYRESRIVASSSDSDRDSDDDSNIWKRSKTKKPPVDSNGQEPKECKSIQEPPSIPVGVLPCSTDVSPRKRKVNNIWSNVLVEETVVSDLCQIGLKNKPIDHQDRNCESYDFTLKYSDPRRELDMEMDDDDDDSDEDVFTDKSEQREKFKKFRDSEELDASAPADGEACKARNFKRKENRFPRLCPSDLEVARKIVRVLAEPKQYLIFRAVHFLGAEKAMHLLKMTEDIEEQGGMLINNNIRRRTPGGVYIQLLKTDKSITPEQVDQIFAFELSYEELKEFRKNQKKQFKKKGISKKKKKRRNKTKREDSDEMQSEDMITVEELITSELDPITPAASEALPVIQAASERSPKPNVSSISEQMKKDIDSDIEDGEIIDS